MICCFVGQNPFFQEMKGLTVLTDFVLVFVEVSTIVLRARTI